MNEAMEPIDPVTAAMLMGRRPDPCEPILEISRKVLTRLMDVVEFGDQLERVEKDRLLALLKDMLAAEQPELWAMHCVGPCEVHPMISKEEADRNAAELIALCKERCPDVPITVDVIPSPFSPLEHFEILAEELAEQVASLRRALDKKNAEAPAPAVVKQQLTTAVCLWKREQDSGFYETGCGQVWHFTDGSTPEENSAYFCHHCGKSLEVQRLIAYQVGDNDIVAAYDPEGAIELLCTYDGYGLDDFTVDDVVAVSDALLDSTETFDQDEGKTITLDKTLRQQLAELTEPAYLHGWE